MRSSSVFHICLLLVLQALAAAAGQAAELQLHTAASYEKYIRLTEQRIESELRSGNGGKSFLALDFSTGSKSAGIRDSLRRGEVYVEKLRTLENKREIDVDDGLIHHWMGAAFIPGIKLEALQAWLQKYEQHDRYFPEIEKSRLISSDGDTYKFHYRLDRKSTRLNSSHT